MPVETSDAVLYTRLADLSRLWNEDRKHAEETAVNRLNSENVITEGLSKDRSDVIQAGVSASRAVMAQLRASNRPQVEGFFQQFVGFLNKEDRGPDDNFTEFVKYLIAQVDAVQSRVFTFGTPVAGGGNVGDGVILRLLKDRYGNDIENQTPILKTAEVLRDAQTGAERKGREVFRLDGGYASHDGIETLGVGQSVEVAAFHSRNGLLQNASFDQVSGTPTAPKTLPSWTPLVAIPGDGTDFTLDATAANVFLPPPNEDTVVYSLAQVTAQTYSQKFVRTRRQLAAEGAYYASVYFNAEINTAVGTLTLGLGTQSIAVVVDGLTGWQRLQLPLDDKLWYPNFAENDADFTLQWAPSGVSPALLIDDATFHPWAGFDGGGYAILPGRTPFLFEDVFTWTDSAVESIIQRMLFEVLGRYAPHSTGGGVTIAEPV